MNQQQNNTIIKLSLDDRFFENLKQAIKKGIMEAINELAEQENIELHNKIPHIILKKRYAVKKRD